MTQESTTPFHNANKPSKEHAIEQEESKRIVSLGLAWIVTMPSISVGFSYSSIAIIMLTICCFYQINDPSHGKVSMLLLVFSHFLNKSKSHHS